MGTTLTTAPPDDRHPLDRHLRLLPVYRPEEVPVMVQHREWDERVSRAALARLHTLLEPGDQLLAALYHRRLRRGIGHEYDLFLWFRGVPLAVLVAHALNATWFGNQRVPHLAVLRDETSIELGMTVPGTVTRVLSQTLWGTPWKLDYTLQPRS